MRKGIGRRVNSYTQRIKADHRKTSGLPIGLALFGEWLDAPSAIHGKGAYSLGSPCGIDPQYGRYLEESLESLFQALPGLIVSAAVNMTNGDKKTWEANLTHAFGDVHRRLLDRLKKYRTKVHVNPVLSAVAVLPKDELAAMAESLVNLTSLKRRVTLEAETVGGPVDVAIISKGDGFVWIRRKHYFKPELNPFFQSTYLQRG